MSFRTAVALLAVALGATPMAAQGDGTLDPSFGPGGSARIPFDRSGTDFRDVPAAVAVDAAGRIVVAGAASETGEGVNAALVRLLPNGYLDSSFGGGPFTFDPNGGDESATDLLAEPSGSLVMAYLVAGAGGVNYGLTRWSASGALLKHVPVYDGLAAGAPVQIAREPVSGRILLACEQSDAGESFLFVWRFQDVPPLQLQPDSTYGAGAPVEIRAAGALDTHLSDIATMADGRLVVAGSVDDGSGGRDLFVARLTLEGLPDATFGSLGQVVLPVDLVPNGDDRASSVAVDAQGRILISASAGAPGFGDDAAVLVRLTLDGALDPSFNGGEPLVVADTDGDDALGGLAVQSDGRMVVAGKVFGPASPMFFAARYLEDGSADWSFGSFGVFTAHFPNSPNDDYAVALALDGGRAVMVGPAEWSAPDYDFGVMRLTSALIFSDDLERGTSAGWSRTAP